MDNGLFIKTHLGDPLVIHSDPNGGFLASLISSSGQVLLSDIPILGISSETSFEEFNSLPSLKTRLRLSALSSKPVIFYNQGLKGGGANQSCCGGKKKVVKKNPVSNAPKPETPQLISTLETPEVNPITPETIQTPFTPSPTLRSYKRISVSYYQFKEYRTMHNIKQERYLNHLEEFLEAAKFGTSIEPGASELWNVRPIEVTDGWLIVIGLLSILAEDGAWKDSWFRIRYDIAKQARRFTLLMFLNYKTSTDESEIFETITRLIRNITIHVDRNRSRLVENGLLEELFAIQKILKLISLAPTWNRKYESSIRMLRYSYSDRNSSLVVSDLMEQFHEMKAQESSELLALLLAIDAIDFEINERAKFEECYDEIFSNVRKAEWERLYHALALLESGVTSGRFSYSYLVSFLEGRGKALYKHEEWKVRERMVSIAMILSKHKNEDVRSAARKVTIWSKKHETHSEIRYILSQKELLYLTIPYINKKLARSVLKECITNIDLAPEKFSGRQDELSELQNTLKQDVIEARVALFGQPGMGKSSLAALYAARNSFNYDIIWRINAQSIPSIKQSIKDLAFRLNIHHIQLAEILDELNHLLSSGSLKWLLIFDNLVDYDTTYPFFPNNGHIIITTRNENIPGIKIEVKKLDIESSVSLLSKLLQYSDEELEKLAETVGCIPRNLTIAAYYIHSSGIKLQKFLTTYTEKKLMSVDLFKKDEKLNFIAEALSMMNENGVHFDMLYEVYKNCYTEDSMLDLKEHLIELTHFKIIDHYFYSDFIRLQSSIYDSVMHKALQDRKLTSSLSFYFDKHLHFDHERVQDLVYLNTYRLYAPHIEAYLLNHNNLVTNKLEINLRARLAEIYYYCMGDTSYTDLNLKRCDDLLNDADMEDPGICPTLHILGHLYYDSDRWTSAQDYYLRSMEIQNLTLDSSLGRCYYNLGMIYKKKVSLSKAKRYFGIASKIYEEELPDSSKKLAYTYDHLGYIYKVFADKRVKNDVFVQFDHLKESPVVEELANSYISLGNMHYAIGDFPSSEIFYNECLDLYRRELPPDHPDIALIYTNLGCIYDSRGDHDSAERCYMLALEIYEKILQPNHPYLATIYNNLGVLYFSKKDLENAQRYLLLCKDIRENLHINQASTSEPKFGNSYKSMRDYEKSEDYYDKSLKMYEYSGKAHDSELIAVYCALGDIHFSKREYKRAIEAYEACKNILEIHSPDRIGEISEIYIKLGIMYEMKGSLDKAKQCFKQSLHLHFNSSNPDNLNTATAYNHLASIHAADKNYNKARTLYDKSFQITSSLINQENRLSFYNAEIAGHSARALEKLSKYHISSQVLNDIHLYGSLANLYLNLGSLFFSQQNYERSEEFYIKHLDLYQQLAPNNHEQFAKAYNNLGNLYYDQGDYDKAEEYYAKCKEIYENETFSQGVNLATVYNNLGSLYLTKGDTEIAQQYYVKSQTIREKVLLPTHEDLLSTRENLDMIKSPTI